MTSFKSFASPSFIWANDKTVAIFFYQGAYYCNLAQCYWFLAWQAQSTHQSKHSQTLEFIQEILSFVRLGHINKGFHYLLQKTTTNQKYKPRYSRSISNPFSCFLECRCHETGELHWQHSLKMQGLLRLSHVIASFSKDETNIISREFFTLLTQRFVKLSPILVFTKSVIEQGREDFFHLKEEIQEAQRTQWPFPKSHLLLAEISEIKLSLTSCWMLLHSS